MGAANIRAKALIPTTEDLKFYQEHEIERSNWEHDVENMQNILHSLKKEYDQHKNDFAFKRYDQLKSMIKQTLNDAERVNLKNKVRLAKMVDVDSKMSSQSFPYDGTILLSTVDNTSNPSNDELLVEKKCVVSTVSSPNKLNITKSQVQIKCSKDSVEKDDIKDDQNNKDEQLQIETEHKNETKKKRESSRKSKKEKKIELTEIDKKHSREKSVDSNVIINQCDGDKTITNVEESNLKKTTSQHFSDDAGPFVVTKRKSSKIKKEKKTTGETVTQHTKSSLRLVKSTPVEELSKKKSDELKKDMDILRKDILKYKQEFWKIRWLLEKLGERYYESKKLKAIKRYPLLKSMIKVTLNTKTDSISKN